MKKTFIQISLMISLVLLVCGGYTAYQNYKDEIIAHEKELEFNKFCFNESVRSIKLLKDRCHRHGVSPDFSDLYRQDSISEKDDLEAIKSAYNKNEDTWCEMAKRYIRAISQRESNIKSVDFEDDMALISYAQLTEENGKRFDSIRTCRTNLYDAMRKIENGYFQYGVFILTIEHREIKNIATLCMDKADDRFKGLEPKNIFYYAPKHTEHLMKGYSAETAKNPL